SGWCQPLVNDRFRTDVIKSITGGDHRLRSANRPGLLRLRKGVQPMSTETKCPFNHSVGLGRTNQDWWPDQLKVELLHQHSARSNPLGQDFDYRKEFKSLDYVAVKRDL